VFDSLRHRLTWCGMRGIFVPQTVIGAVSAPRHRASARHAPRRPIKRDVYLEDTTRSDTLPVAGHQRALLVGVSLPRIPLWQAEESLDELERLADTAQLSAAKHIIQTRDRINPTYYIGSGKAAELADLAKDHDADLIIFDNDLSPAQMRNLEKLTDQRILDRSGLILDIFARHARTRTAQIQVELAQLNYLLPRLTRQWTHLSRQAGGGAIRGMGAAGVRGPGETQLETDRRIVRKRIRDLSAKLDKISSQMAVGRSARSDAFKVTLVGYTNAGKSTLMRALSGSDVLVQDQLFATLDSTTRSVELDDRHRILLTDTVGFIKRLPHHLFASFRATLTEAVEADLLLHVVDLSHPHYESQVDTVAGVLRDLGLEDHPTLMVYNKADQLEPDTGQALPNSEQQRDGVRISALTGYGLDTLRQRIATCSQDQDVTLDLIVPQHDGRLLAQLDAQGDILERTFEANNVHLRVRLGTTLADRWQLGRYAVTAAESPD
jgi:GTPase